MLTKYLRLADSLYSDGPSQKYDFYVATKVNASLMKVTGEMWSQLFFPEESGGVEVLSYLALSFPKQLRDKYAAQLLKLYNTCVFLSQFLPVLIDQNNRQEILQLGPYAAEVVPECICCKFFSICNNMHITKCTLF